MRTLFADLRYGLRLLRQALGIGANTAIFSTLDAVLLRHLSYQDPPMEGLSETSWASSPTFMSAATISP